ncbi:YeeE/YedE family protein [Alphaproteobacteria bacterium]|nr:YeeE/YedE family protein [Alphaproteobacteria bacterium]
MGLALLSAAISGIIFGIGLALAGMLNPAKVAGFLNIFGLWDPSLMLVMAGGIAVNAAGYFLFLRSGKPLFASSFSLPEARQIDKKLIIGSVLFGVGWGLAGLCPGPVVASIGLDPLSILPFLAVMLAGLKLGVIIRTRI